jgi:hypothetical protein
MDVAICVCFQVCENAVKCNLLSYLETHTKRNILKIRTMSSLVIGNLVSRVFGLERLIPIAYHGLLRVREIAFNGIHSRHFIAIANVSVLGNVFLISVFLLIR